MIEHLASKVDSPHAGDAMDVGLSFAGARSFKALQEHFRGSSPSGRSLRDLTDQFLLFLQASPPGTPPNAGDPHHVEAGRQLIENVINGRLFRAMDDDAFLGLSEAQLRANVSKISSILKVTTVDNGKIIDDLTSLFHYLHRPITCLKASQSVPDGVKHVVRELVSQQTDYAATYIKRDTPLILVSLNGFCDLPPELANYYGSMFSLADSTAIRPMTDLLKALYRVTDENKSSP